MLFLTVDSTTTYCDDFAVKQTDGYVTDNYADNS